MSWHAAGLDGAPLCACLLNSSYLLVVCQIFGSERGHAATATDVRDEESIIWSVRE